MSDAKVTFEIITLFPELFDSFLSASLLGKAVTSGLLAVHCTNPRDFAAGKHKSVDDTPFGGGPGMVLRPEPLAGALDHIAAARGPAHRILLSPQGRLFNQALATELATRARIVLVCGRYEGVDERIATLYADDVVSVGDFVLAGGEVAAALVIEAVTRLVPGVIGKMLSTVDESFSAGRLEYPQFTQPRDFRGLGVPEVLLSGDHAAIDRWRRREALRRTLARRPDLLTGFPVTPAERHLLDDDHADVAGAGAVDPDVDSGPSSA